MPHCLLLSVWVTWIMEHQILDVYSVRLDIEQCWSKQQANMVSFTHTCSHTHTHMHTASMFLTVVWQEREGEVCWSDRPGMGLERPGECQALCRRWWFTTTRIKWSVKMCAVNASLPVFNSAKQLLIFLGGKLVGGKKIQLTWPFQLAVSAVFCAEFPPGAHRHPDDGVHGRDGECGEGDVLHQQVFHSWTIEQRQTHPGAALWHRGCNHHLDQQGTHRLCPQLYGALSLLKFHSTHSLFVCSRFDTCISSLFLHCW